jgi:hypothetical protein
VHHALDVLDDDDRIVDEENGEHHAEQRQRVDRVAEQRQHAEGTEQDDGHGERRDQGGAYVLEEQQHHEEHEPDGLEQRDHDLLDRDPHERCRVDRIRDLEARREGRGHLREPLLHPIGRCQRVRACREANAEARGRLVVVEALDVEVFAAELDARDIAQPHLRAIGIDAHQDRAELLGRCEPALRRDRRVQGLALHGGCATELADGDLCVLRDDRGLHVERGEPKA